ncbi:MarR family winged helix-turn-helix transcriptional regulator [Mycobacterium sp.]|uniref:MarR family winged helix-turn-helix transcriptional regulator n=1 Tax=Mycobacterium sp. TaxID=1785 RepID=UPI002DA1FA05|nr:MarR family winged helix-turn-helix transcriptional regulator [Mycobacterium sp.]
MTERSIDPANRIAYLVRMVSGTLMQQIEQALRPVGLTQVQLGVLVHLDLVEGDAGLSTAELSRLGGVTPQSMASALANLQRRELVLRGDRPARGRAIELRITDDGRELARLAQTLTAGVDARALALIEPADRDRLRELLQLVAMGSGAPIPRVRGIEVSSSAANETKVDDDE